MVHNSNNLIIVDGKNIHAKSVRDIRHHLSIIPQDPHIFNGTLKFNLDPLSNCTEDKLWEILSMVHLDEYVLGLPEGLETELEESGTSLSIGQRQLLCIGRALAKGSHIIVLDEATACVDPETDYILQQTIKKEFAGIHSFHTNISLHCTRHRTQTPNNNGLRSNTRHGQRSNRRVRHTSKPSRAKRNICSNGK